MGKFLRTVFLVISCILCFSAARASFSLSESHTNVQCNGGNDGSINVSVSGGSSPFSYSWADGPTSQDRSNISAGLYSLTVTDFLGATASISINIGQPAPMTTSFAITNVSCGGGNDGIINLSVSGGTPGYTFLWNDGVSTEDRLNVTAANYYVTVTDAAGCSKVDSANVTQPMGIVPTATTTASNCNLANGQIDLTVQYGSPSYTYLWNDGTTTEDRNSLAPGNYSVTITDNINCSVTFSTVVNQVSGAMSINTTATNPNCFNGSDGKITVNNVIGSSAPYTFNWSNGSTGPTNNGLSANTYIVTATSGTGCTATKSISLSNPDSLNLIATPIPITCFGANNGAVTTSVNGGAPPYSFLWSGGNVTESVTGLSPGTYSVTVTDSKGCSTFTAAVVTQPLKLVVNTTTSPLACSGGPTGSVFTSVTGGTGGYTYWWGSGITTPNRINVNSGTYTVTVTDANGCSSIASGTIQPYTVMNLSATQTNVACYGGQTGSVNLSISNGWASYFYNWSNGESTEDISNLSAGNYTVTVTDGHACTATKSVSITQPSFPMTINSTVSDLNCNGAADGAISLSVSNGSAPYSYQWSDTTSGANRINLSGGNYSVTVTDNVGCSSASAYTVNEPTPILLTSTHSDVTCFGINNGYVHLNVTGGFAPYSYSWNDGGNTQNRDSLTAGNYSVTVSDTHGCSVSASEIVGQPPVTNLSLNVTDATCNGLANGAINLNLPGAGPYTYSWNDGNNNQNRNNLSAGNYSVTVMDNSGCSASAIATVQEPTALSINETHNDETCLGKGNGSADIQVSGGTPGYSFVWSNGMSSSSISNLSAGNYQVTVSDAQTCSAVRNINIQSGSTLILTKTQTNVSCFGGNNASLSISTNGGTAPFAYSWNDGNINATRNNLNAGNYSVTVTDAQACAVSASYSITEPTAISLSGLVQNALCFGNANGSIDLTANGGTGSYAYSWSNGTNNQDLNNLASGNYSVTVTDAQSCTASETYNISEPAALNVTINASPANCNGGNDGALIASVTGGNGNYVYQWNNGSSTTAINNISAGNYSLTVTDDKGCSTTGNQTVTQPAAIQIAETITNVSCNGGQNGSVQTSVTGGNGAYTYSWSNGANAAFLNNLPTGNYSLSVEDGNHCTAIKTIIISEPAPLQLTTSITNAGCNGSNSGAVDLSVAGGIPSYQYLWNNSSTNEDLNLVAAGNYSVTVTDGNSCTASVSASVNQATPIQITLNATNATCFGSTDGTITTNVSGGTPNTGGNYFYNWSNASTTKNLSGLAANIYSLTVSDASNCQATATANITQPSSIQIIETHQNVSCYGLSNGNISVTANGGNGGYTYLWDNASTGSSLQNIPANTYTVTVTDNKQCSAVKSINLTQPAAISVNETHSDYACAGSEGAIQLSIAGGTTPYHFQWTDGSSTQNRTQLNAGNYQVLVTDSNQCSTSKTIQIAALPTLNTTINTVDAHCFGSSSGSIDLQVSGGSAPYQYVWNNGATTQDLNQLTAGVYEVLIQDARQCAATQSVTINQPSAIVISDSSNAVSCYGGNNGSILLSVNGGQSPYSFEWNNSASTQNISGLNAGNYSVTVHDAANCQSIQPNIVVAQPQAMEVIKNSTPAGCNSSTGAAQVTVTGGTAPYTFQWSNGSHSSSLNQVNAGNYTLSITDHNGCMISDSLTIAQTQPLTLQADIKNSSCPESNNGQILLITSGGSPAYEYTWSNGAHTAQVENLAEGNYHVTVSDNHQCTASADYTVSHNYVLLAEVNATTKGSLNTLSVQANEDHNNTYSWSPSSLVQCATCSETRAYPSVSTNFTVIVTDENGCRAQDSVMVEVKPISPLFVPNAFTPNQDGNNDVLQVYGDKSSIEYFEFKIFNRWGEKVFESNNAEFTWDGIYRGSPVENGVYIYLMKTVFTDGSKSDYKGSITLIR